MKNGTVKVKNHDLLQQVINIYTIYATTDGFGNIYIIGVVNEDSFCITKIDLYCNQLFSKL
ncbi:MAG: hypothetical protein IPG90_21740 [Bacteroidetes bacterium]|nr:hypothetical protein [Bacteroidota bacterium]